MRKSKSKQDKVGKAQKCQACETITPWYVILAHGVLVCVSCYEEERWHHLSATKEAITKGGGSTGYKTTGRQRNVNRSVDRWVESSQGTSKSPQKPKF